MGRLHESSVDLPAVVQDAQLPVSKRASLGGPDSPPGDVTQGIFVSQKLDAVQLAHFYHYLLSMI